MAEQFHASDIGWQVRARCSEAPYDFTPDHEREKELEFVRSTWCDRCPVRMECLAYALLYRAHGYWGGTSTTERRLLGYVRNRVKCPVCKCKGLIKVQDHEICQGCGMSWNRVPAKEGALT